MEIKNFTDFIFHIDHYIGPIVKDFGIWAYFLFFGIIFVETGVVIMPFLPGDSFLFVLGTFAALDTLNIVWLLIILSTAAVLGDSANYAIGKYLGAKLLARENSRLIKKEHIEQTHKFYEKYGAKTIVIARFVPIIRTFAPFVAGVGEMSYIKFFSYNVIGGVMWVFAFTLGGYFFGNIKIIKENFSITIFIIIFISILPAIIEFLRQKYGTKK
jgi:membrane-associated protein